MMIAQNPVLRAVLVVTAFWYAALFLLAGINGVAPWKIIYVFPQSAAIAGLGCAGGFALMLAKGFLGTAATESSVRAGSRMRSASITLGGGFALPTQPCTGDEEALLAEQPWWPAVKVRAPEYADAIHAVLRVMSAIPKLPASPYPGGHGGRTLIEHSLAVAMQTIKEAKTWEYHGQKDKRGNIRVPLQGEEAHKFTAHDAPLLLLTGLAHDIGKIDCYAMAEGEDASRTKGPVLRVVEVKRMHDTEGARLLRRIPEVMALPLADRTALLTAIGYYHHPFAIPVSGWVTDRVRSLTELLAIADIAVGVAEGHTMLDADERMSEEDDDDSPRPVADDALRASSGITQDDLEKIAVEDEADLMGLMAAIAPKPQQKAAPSKTVTPAPAPASTTTAAPVGSAAGPANLKREVSMFMETIRKTGAVNGKVHANRIAWKHGNIVYVMEPVMRQRILNSHGKNDMAWAGEAFAENPNGSPYTLALLEQLHELGILITEHDGEQYSPKRSLFYMATKTGRRMPAILLRADRIPGLGNAGNADPIKILGPLWGAHQAKDKSRHDHTAEVPAQEPGSPKEEELHPAAGPAPVSQGPLHEDLATGGAAPPALDLDDDDLPFGLASIPSLPEGPQDSPAPEPIPTIQNVDPAPVLASLIITPEFSERYELHWRERGGINHALIRVNSDGGRVLTSMLANMREAQPEVSFADLTTVTMAVDTDAEGNGTAFETAFLIPMPK